MTRDFSKKEFNLPLTLFKNIDNYQFRGHPIGLGILSSSYSCFDLKKGQKKALLHSSPP